MQHKIKNLFEKNKKAYLSGEYIADHLKISRAAVWKHIRSMRSKGYNIIGKKRQGYILVSSKEYADLSTFSYQNFKIIYYDKIGSTQTQAKKIAGLNESRPTLLIGRTQFSSYGRMQRTWLSPPGGIWFSLILKPPCTALQASAITLLMGLSVVQALTKASPGNAFQIKWPNDVLVNNKKICGIITEIQIEMDKVAWLVTGVGLNVNNAIPAVLGRKATSLMNESNRMFDLPKLLTDILKIFMSHYHVFLRRGWASFIPLYERYSVLKGKRVIIKSGSEKIRGTVLGMNEFGGLIIKTPRESRLNIYSGEILRITSA